MYLLKMLRLFWVLLLVVTFLSGCGLKAGTSVPNDPEPTGGIVQYSGTFTGLSGKSVSGSVQILQIPDNTYVIRLVGVSAPDESGLTLLGKANTTTVYGPTPLRSHLGTQNYYTNLSGALVWSAVMIRSSINSQTPDYGQADLHTPGN
jgi:hypothetical protein